MNLESKRSKALSQPKEALTTGHTLDNDTLLKIRLRYSTDTRGTLVVHVSRLNAANTAEAVVSRLLPLRDQAALSVRAIPPQIEITHLASA